MVEEKLGDIWDVAKGSLLSWLEGEWSAHPMLTVAPAKGFAAAYGKLVNAHVVSSTALGRNDAISRESWLEPARSLRDGNLFLDPDSGLIIREPAREHLSVDEFADIAGGRRNGLTVVFDQSFDGRYDRATLINRKLRILSKRGVHAFAYDSNACFIIAATTRSLINKARSRVLEKSGLPKGRLRGGR